MDIITREDLSEILFDEIFPKDMVIKYEEQNNLNLKNKFVEFLESRNMEPKFDKYVSKIMLLSIIREHGMNTVYGDEIPFERMFYAFDDITLLAYSKK